MELIHRSTSGRLPTSTFDLCDGGETVGFVQIRHQPSHGEGIPPECASHVYYEVREDRRRRGYGSKLLELGLKEAKRLGLAEVVVCCFETNPASRRIIEKNGGKSEGSFVTDVEEKIFRNRFVL